VEDEECKLPSRVTIEWPEGDKLENNSKLPAGTTIGKESPVICYQHYLYHEYFSLILSTASIEYSYDDVTKHFFAIFKILLKYSERTFKNRNYGENLTKIKQKFAEI